MKNTPNNFHIPWYLKEVLNIAMNMQLISSQLIFVAFDFLGFAVG
jgi:hypothetical protein